MRGTRGVIKRCCLVARGCLQELASIPQQGPGCAQFYSKRSVHAGVPSEAMLNGT